MSLDFQIDLASWADSYPFLLPVIGVLVSFFGTAKISLYWVILQLMALFLATWAIYLFLPRSNLPWDKREQLGFSSYLRFTLPREIYLHKSAFSDLALMSFNSVLYRVLGIGSLFVAYGLAEPLARFLTEKSVHLGFVVSGLPATWWLLGIFAIGLFLTNDFAEFYAHYIFHKLPALWELHKVHHSAEVLTPITAFRDHPLLALFRGIISALIVGGYQGVMFFVFPCLFRADIALAGGLLSYVILHTNFLLGHYPIPLSYGFLDRIIVTPAIHRVHHARSLKYYDKNLGNRLTIWDILFGTFYLPTAEELCDMEIGLDESEYHSTSRYSWVKLIWRPIVQMAKRILEQLPFAKRPNI